MTGTVRRRSNFLIGIISIFFLSSVAVLGIAADAFADNGQSGETCQVERTNRRELGMDRFEINNSQVNGKDFTWIPGKLVPNAFNLGEFEPVPVRTFDECVDLCKQDPECRAFSTELATFEAWLGGYLPKDELVHCHRKTEVNRKCMWDALDTSEVHVPGFRGGKNNVWMLEWGTFLPLD